MDVEVNGTGVKAYVDMGSNYITMKELVAQQLELPFNKNETVTLRGFGNGCVKTSGETGVQKLTIDEVELDVVFNIVPNIVQFIAIIIGQPCTESPELVVYKDASFIS